MPFLSVCVCVFVNDTGDVYSHEKIDLDFFFLCCFDFITGTLEVISVMFFG